MSHRIGQVVRVVKLDDYGTAVYFIEEGKADIQGDPREEAKALGPGDAIGEIALLLTGQRTSTVVARTPMRLLSLSGQDFELIRARVPEFERSRREPRATPRSGNTSRPRRRSSPIRSAVGCIAANASS